MKKAASIFLRAEIEPRDMEQLIRWMGNPHITRYLNEEPGIIRSLEQLLWTVPAPMLSYHFNRWGHFLLVCRPQEEAIGFIKLRALQENGVYEIVYVIGEETLWGQGYGEAAIRAALNLAFLHLRGNKIIAKIHPENLRSIRTVCACGFQQNGTSGNLLVYSVTVEDHLKNNR